MNIHQNVTGLAHGIRIERRFSEESEPGRLIGIVSFLLICLFWVCLCWGGLWGCSDDSDLKQMPYLIRVGDCIVYKDDFEAAFQALATGYTTDGVAGGNKMTRLKLRVLDQLAEELLLCRHAKELNINVTAEEMDDAVGKIKAQYPPAYLKKSCLNMPYPLMYGKSGCMHDCL